MFINIIIDWERVDQSAGTTHLSTQTHGKTEMAALDDSVPEFHCASYRCLYNIHSDKTSIKIKYYYDYH